MAGILPAGVTAEHLARLPELLDRQDIFDCIQRVSRAIDRFDGELSLTAYHPDAVIDAGAFVGDPAAVYAGGAALHEVGQTATQHHLTNHVCEIDGDSAHTETYYLYVGHNRDGGNWAAGGRYLDRLERRDGAWKISFRYTILEWSGSIAENEVPLFAGVAEVHLNGVPSRTKDDASYRRPLTNRREVRMPDDPTRFSKPES